MGCSQTLSGIAQDCSPSMGGILEAYIVNYDDVLSKTLTDGVITALEMAEGATFLQYHFKRGTSAFTSTLNKDDSAGTNYVSTEISLYFSRMETAKRVEMAALSIGELAVIVKDANGVYWYFGYDEPVSASAGGGETGTARGDANRYSITLTDNSQTYPYEISEDAVTAAVG